MEIKTFEIRLKNSRGDKELQMDLRYDVPMAYFGAVVSYLEKWRRSPKPTTE